MVRWRGTVITDVNPFVYSRPLAPDDIIDRDEETQRLLAAAVGGHYVRLYAPRKYGKTSLLGRVLRDGERHEGLIPIMVLLLSNVNEPTVQLASFQSPESYVASRYTGGFVSDDGDDE